MTLLETQLHHALKRLLDSCKPTADIRDHVLRRASADTLCAPEVREQASAVLMARAAVRLFEGAVTREAGAPPAPLSPPETYAGISGADTSTITWHPATPSLPGSGLIAATQPAAASIDTPDFLGRVIAAASEAMSIGQGKEWKSFIAHIHEWHARQPAPVSAGAAVPAELRNAFMTLETHGGEGRSIVLKFNQRTDAYAVHDFLLKAPVKEGFARAADVATGGAIAPWPDFAGNPISAGDTIVHPSGETALVTIDATKDCNGRWRAVYQNGESLWLGNQIGSKGMAVVGSFPDVTAVATQPTGHDARWQRITKPGQVTVGTKLRFTIGDKKYGERAKRILHPGLANEEIIYNKRQNYYLITSMAIANKGSQKNVEFLAAAHAAPTAGDPQ